MQLAYVGRTLEQVTVTGPRTVRRHSPSVLSELTGSVLAEVGRHGKYLLFKWRSGQVLVAHLRMSGQLLAAEDAAPFPPHTHAVLAFKGAGQLRFVDPRTFGELFLGSAAVAGEPAGKPSGRAGGRVARGAQDGGTTGIEELAHLGPDALDIEPAYLSEAFAGKRAPLKAVLVDQRVLAGVGNIYADEICYDARLRPERPAGSLARSQVRRLGGSIRSVLEAAIVDRGSSLRDRQYLDLEGQAGRYQAEHKVYGRAGQACTVCGAPVERLRFGARSAFACCACQR